jgi:hypothetical protein
MSEPLGKYLTGWKTYFRLAETPNVFADKSTVGSTIGCVPYNSSTGSADGRSIVS